MRSMCSRLSVRAIGLVVQRAAARIGSDVFTFGRAIAAGFTTSAGALCNLQPAETTPDASGVVRTVAREPRPQLAAKRPDGGPGDRPRRPKFGMSKIVLDKVCV